MSQGLGFLPQKGASAGGIWWNLEGFQVVENVIHSYFARTSASCHLAHGNPNPACVDSSPAQTGRAKQVWSQTSALKLLGSFGMTRTLEKGAQSMKFDINEATKKDISDEGMGCQENLIFQEVVGSHCCSCNHFIISWPPARHHGLLLVHPKLCSPRHRAKGQGRECPAPPKISMQGG